MLNTVNLKQIYDWKKHKILLIIFAFRMSIQIQKYRKHIRDSMQTN